MKMSDLELTRFGDVEIGSYFWRVNEENKHQKCKFLKVTASEGRKCEFGDCYMYPFPKLQFVYIAKVHSAAVAELGSDTVSRAGKVRGKK